MKKRLEELRERQRAYIELIVEIDGDPSRAEVSETATYQYELITKQIRTLEAAEGVNHINQVHRWESGALLIRHSVARVALVKANEDTPFMDTLFDTEEAAIDFFSKLTSGRPAFAPAPGILVDKII